MTEDRTKFSLDSKAIDALSKEISWLGLDVLTLCVDGDGVVWCMGRAIFDPQEAVQRRKDQIAVLQSQITSISQG